MSIATADNAWINTRDSQVMYDHPWTNFGQVCAPA